MRESGDNLTIFANIVVVPNKKNRPIH